MNEMNIEQIERLLTETNTAMKELQYHVERVENTFRKIKECAFSETKLDLDIYSAKTSYRLHKALDHVKDDDYLIDLSTAWFLRSLDDLLSRLRAQEEAIRNENA